MGVGKARGLMIGSMTVFGTISLLVRAIPLASGAIAFMRAALAALLLGAVMLFRRERLSLEGGRRDWILMAVSGVAMGFNWILLFEAYRYTSVAVATLGYYFAPVLVAVLCPIIFKEKTSPFSLLCFVFATAGIAVMTFGGADNGVGHYVGILFALGAAVLYASVVLMNKAIGNIGATERTLVQFICAAAVLFPYTLIRGELQLASVGAVGWICLLVVGLFHTGITYLCYFSSIKHLGGAEIAILSYIDPLVAVICSVAVLGERPGALQLLGGAVALAFALVNEIFAARVCHKNE